MLRPWNIYAVLAAGLIAGCQAVAPSDPASATARATTSATVSFRPPTPAQAQAQLPPDVVQIIDHLASGDIQQRDDALVQFAQMLESPADGATVLQLSQQIRLNVAAQLRTLMNLPDMESRARAARLLAFNEGMANFSVAALDVAQPLRDKILAWGFSFKKDGGADAVGLAFSDDPDDRIEASHRLVSTAGPQADWVLGRLILDEQRLVSLAAMDAAWDRPASNGLIDALWTKAVLLPARQNGLPPDFLSDNTKSAWTPAAGEQHVVQVGDHTVQVYVEDYKANLRAADADIATEVLVAMHSPEVGRRLETMIDQLVSIKPDPSRGVNYRIYLISPNYGTAGTNMQRLIDTYHPASAVRLLADTILSGQVNDGYDNMFNNQPMRMSSRIDAMALLCRVTDLDRNDLKLIRRQEYGNRWSIAGHIDEEEAAVKKVREWWTEHHAEYGQEAAPAPATGALAPMPRRE